MTDYKEPEHGSKFSVWGHPRSKIPRVVLRRDGWGVLIGETLHICMDRTDAELFARSKTPTKELNKIKGGGE